MAAQGGSKTEKATPERLKKARAEGQFLTSRSLVGAIQFACFVTVAGQLMPAWRGNLAISLQHLLDRATSAPINESEWPVIVRAMLLEAFVPTLKIIAIPLALGLGLHLLLTRGGFSFSLLTPKFDRLNPFARLKNLPGQNVKSVLQAVLLILTLSWVIYSYLKVNLPALMQLPFESPLAGVIQIGQIVHSLLWKAALLFLLFGSVEAFQQYRDYSSRLKMSKEEIKEETKRSQGDPQVKARIRRLRRDLLRRRMMSEVPKATAVIVNPTHYAVAIRYDGDTMPCPMVTAKGRNWLALRIRQIAVENQVPIIENPPLARALYEVIDVGRAISPEFYKAVAEILAYVYRLMGIKLPR